jgi:threonylcarbamoyladenosine tRNA methylthiotransferase MtaB
MKIALETLGCKLNQAETEKLSWDLAASGYEVISSIEQADIFILNTCTVTNTADAKSRQRLRNVHKINPAASLVVIGCYAERNPDILKDIPGVRLVVPQKNKAQLVSQIEEYFPHDDNFKISTHNILASLRTRAFIKIQEGCLGACAYCIVPRVRQREISVPYSQIIPQIQHRESLGYKEIVLTGTRVGGYSDNGIGLKKLLSLILENTRIPRIRLSSLQPQELSPELLSLWKNPRLLPHFHMALQSGCDLTLHMMRRQYSLIKYIDTVRMIRKVVSAAAISTDIIVGFPGEDDAMFEESFHTCEQIRFARIHVFPFSARPGTAAATLPLPVQDITKQERSRRMLDLGEKSLALFRELFHDQERMVLWENQDKQGYWSGWTDNYIPVKIKGKDLFNTISLVKIE